jgi:hypothetical protein
LLVHIDHANKFVDDAAPKVMEVRKMPCKTLQPGDTLWIFACAEYVRDADKHIHWRAVCSATFTSCVELADADIEDRVSEHRCTRAEIDKLWPPPRTFRLYGWLFDNVVPCTGAVFLKSKGEQTYLSFHEHDLVHLPAPVSASAAQRPPRRSTLSQFFGAPAVAAGASASSGSGVRATSTPISGTPSSTSFRDEPGADAPAVEEHTAENAEHPGSGFACSGGFEVVKLNP